MSSQTTPFKISCTMQYRLGVLDRMLGMMTHWGVLPQGMATHIDDGAQTMTCEMTLAGEHKDRIQPLLKALEKQVCVLHAGLKSEVTPLPLEQKETGTLRARMAQV